MRKQEIPVAEQARLDQLFTPWPPRGDQGERIEVLSAAAREFARAIMLCVPSSAERTLAIRAVEEAKMRAEQAILVNELPGSSPGHYPSIH